jgi:hypothetical protein
MNVTMRLYRKIDSDLITLYYNHGFPFVKAVRLSLDMAAGTKPPAYIRLPTSEPLASIPKKVTTNVPIDDPKTIAWVKSIPAGTRNDFIKNMLRGYLTGPILLGNEDFFNGETKPMISIKKERKQSQEIDQILQENGISKQELLRMLQKNSRQPELSHTKASSDEMTPAKSEASTSATLVSEAREPKAPVPEIPVSEIPVSEPPEPAPVISYPEPDAGGDDMNDDDMNELFGKMGQMTSIL